MVLDSRFVKFIFLLELIFVSYIQENIKNKNEISIIIDKCLKKKLLRLGLRRMRDKSMLIILVLGEEKINIISAYALQIGLEGSIEQKF